MEQSLVRTSTALPALLARGGEHLQTRFLEFFTVNIRNKNTRAAYARAAATFLRWCELRGLPGLDAVKPIHVAAYLEELGGKYAKPTVKQHLACIRMLFDWLVVGQAAGSNPAHSVRGPRHSVQKGSTPVLNCDEARALLDHINTSTVIGLRDRALVAALVFTFARVSAAISLKVGDYYAQRKRWWLRLAEKNGKVIEAPCHHALEEYLDAYIEGAGIGEERALPLFRSAVGRTDRLSTRPMGRSDVYRMVKRRAKQAGIETEISCHTFRATGITAYLKNGGKLEVAQQMAGHATARTTGLYDRRSDDISLDEVERIAI